MGLILDPVRGFAGSPGSGFTGSRVRADVRERIARNYSSALRGTRFADVTRNFSSPPSSGAGRDFCHTDRMPHRRPPRLKAFDYLGSYRNFVTCCSFDRHSAFIDRDAVDCVHEKILRTCAECDIEEIVSLFMPDHLHSLFEGLTAAAAFVPS